MADKDSESEAPLTASTGNQATQAASSATEAADAAKAAAVETALIVYHLFEDPLYFDDLEGPHGPPLRLAAALIAHSMNFLIVISTFAFCLETMDDYSPDPQRNPIDHEWWATMWLAVEVTCVVMFTADLCVRGAGAAVGKVFPQFVGEVMNWIDFMAIAPFYISIFADEFVDLRFLRVIRLVRILRTLKSAKHGSLGAVVADIVKSSLGALFIPVYFMILALVVFASMMYYIERTDEMRCTLGDGTVIENWDTGKDTLGNEGCTSDYGCACAGTLTYHTYDGQEWTNEMYESIPHSCWWCIVTFTTVGYGDMYPRTTMGRVLCVVTMYTGIFFLAMPLTIVGSSFANAWEKLQTKKLKAQAYEARASGEWVFDKAEVVGRAREINGHLRRTKMLLNIFHKEAEVGGGITGEGAVAAKWLAIIEGIEKEADGIRDLMQLYEQDVALSKSPRAGTGDIVNPLLLAATVDEAATTDND